MWCPLDVGVMLWFGSEASRGSVWSLVLPVGPGFWRRPCLPRHLLLPSLGCVKFIFPPSDIGVVFVFVSILFILHPPLESPSMPPELTLGMPPASRFRLSGWAVGSAPGREHPGFAFLKFLFCAHCFLGRWASGVGGRCGGREEEISFSLPGLKSIIAQCRGHSRIAFKCP